MISVCIATHNGEKYIKRQLESILSQLDFGDEVIISDDGSTDATLTIINSINDARIRVYNFKQPDKTKHLHRYVCKNFENTLKHAKGDFVFLSDQDDEWLPNKVDVCVRDLENSDLVLHDFSHINERDEIVKEKHYNGRFRPHNYFLRRGLHYGCAMAFRRNVLEYVLPFPKNLILHDYWIGILSEILGNFYYEETPLIKYRVHQNNTSVSQNGFLFKLYYRFYTLLCVMVRCFTYKIHHKI